MYSQVSHLLMNPVVWEPVLKLTPKNARGIAFSQRGYKGSTPLTVDEALCQTAPSELHKTHVADYAAFLQFVVEQLKVPQRSSDGTGGITLIFWSKGCAAATGLFYFQNELASSRQLIDKYVSSVVLYEAPLSAVFGVDPGDCANALFYHRLANPPEDPGFMFAKYVTGFFRNSPEYLTNKGGKQVLEYYRTGALEPDFQQFLGKVNEPEFLPSILHWFLKDKQEERLEACHEAINAMAKSSLKKIGILWGSDGPPECIEGSWIAEKWVKEVDGEKLSSKQFEGGNHYIQFYDPAGFWESVLELSV